MKSALKTIAFATATDTEGAIALMEVALEALDRANQHMGAALLDLALTRLLERQAAAPEQRRLHS